MSLFLFLTVVQLLVAAALVITILMQRSEGGGLGIGGSPNGMMSARGAADFLSRSTKWLAICFVALSIALAAVAVKETGSSAITSTVERGAGAPADPITGSPADAAPATEAPAEAPSDDPLADVAG
ncbi:preprotein translocase subunit SecG [Pontixanthobacter aquaemixtae]|uniref:Protein-export membrane protein SecG n=1 Tax=Pontixanthobacter aquaemixtae TaxID=1958940 RepID=A0A844ZS44_9SPHN|nr:preprotein translocase subunit SecG [Pontixanthobacter aquaemixtae]MXO90314.1 preprotein translocase subunit SecG [Pontixanthobacter aquaemixtae]